MIMNVTDSVCRICIKTECVTINLFNYHDAIQYSTKLEKCVGITVSENDSLPNAICTSCASELNTAYRFAVKCEEANRLLHRLAAIKGDYLQLDYEPVDNLDINGSYSDNDDKDNATLSESVFNSSENIHIQKTESSKEILKGHEDIHYNKREKKFACGICGKRYLRNNDVKIHMRNHTGETPYACPYCPRRYQRPGALVIHKRTHTGEMPFPCNICGKCFADISSMRKHQLAHSNVRRYPCNICDKSFKTKRYVENHIMRTHNNEKDHLINVGKVKC